LVRTRKVKGGGRAVLAERGIGIKFQQNLEKRNQQNLEKQNLEKKILAQQAVDHDNFLTKSFGALSQMSKMMGPIVPSNPNIIMGDKSRNSDSKLTIVKLKYRFECSYYHTYFPK
jgi:hypothetical protein